MINANVRDLAEQAGVKDGYDRFYAWTSGFVHGQWAEVRNTIYETCENPLHRLHLAPDVPARVQGDVVPDAEYLMNRILGLVGRDLPKGMSLAAARL